MLNMICNAVCYAMGYAMSSSPPFGINKAKELSKHKTKHINKQRYKPYFINT